MDIDFDYEDSLIAAPEAGYSEVPLDVDDPFQLMCLADPIVREGKFSGYRWQKEFHQMISAVECSSSNPFKYYICACNSAGKDSILIAWMVIFFCLKKIRFKVVGTSASGNQITTQTEPAIRRAAELVNNYFKEIFGQTATVFIIRQRFIKCVSTGATIRLFATDDAGKAEGFHPEPGAEMMIFMNEVKSISQDIHLAVRRCKGFSYWLEFSTPGEPVGDFYEGFMRAAPEHKLHIDYKRCPHLSESERQEDLEKYGEDSFYFRSSWLALFTRIVSTNVVSEEFLPRCNRKAYDESNYYGGFDVAGHLAENVITIFRGNRFCFRKPWREKDVSKVGEQAEKIFRDFPGITINGDGNGIGAVAVNYLSLKGFSINSVVNQGKPNNPTKFVNRGAELYYKCKRMVERGFLLDPFEDKETVNQLCSRRFKELVKGKMALEPKHQHPGPSPDRADSYVLAVDLIPEPEEDLVIATSDKVFDWRKYHMELYNMEILKQGNGKLYSVLDHVLYAKN